MYIGDLLDGDGGRADEEDSPGGYVKIRRSVLVLRENYSGLRITCRGSRSLEGDDEQPSLEKACKLLWSWRRGVHRWEGTWVALPDH